MMQTCTFALTLEEGSLIVQALAERPFKEVFHVIASLNRQANGFNDDAADGDCRHAFALTAGEAAMAIKALGAMPFDSVCGLIATLNAQIRQQYQTGAAVAAGAITAAA